MATGLMVVDDEINRFGSTAKEEDIGTKGGEGGVLSKQMSAAPLKSIDKMREVVSFHQGASSPKSGWEMSDIY